MNKADFKHLPKGVWQQSGLSAKVWTRMLQSEQNTSESKKNSKGFREKDFTHSSEKQVTCITMSCICIDDEFILMICRSIRKHFWLTLGSTRVIEQFVAKSVIVSEVSKVQTTKLLDRWLKKQTTENKQI